MVFSLQFCFGYKIFKVGVLAAFTFANICPYFVVTFFNFIIGPPSIK